MLMEHGTGVWASRQGEQAMKNTCHGSGQADKRLQNNDCCRADFRQLPALTCPMGKSHHHHHCGVQGAIQGEQKHDVRYIEWLEAFLV